MALSINTNNGALQAAQAASSVNRSMETSMQRLSTGLRINAAKDDSAGIAIATRFTAEIKGYTMAIRNASDAQAMIDVGEGALSEVTNILQRMREIAVQASNDTASTADRTALNKEYADLATEILRIEDSTTWSNTQILDGSEGSSGAFKFLIGTGSSGTITSDTLTVTFDAVNDLTTNSVSGTGTATVLTTQASAILAISAIDADLILVNAERGQLGSKSNRLDHAVANMSNMVTNLGAALGRVQDADFASESSNLAKTQILQQASTAMLAQANASKQGVLALVNGR
jgi:flagellin